MSPGWGLALIFALFCLRTLPAPTPAGIHCPTAEVQTVVDGGLERAPLPGEAEFKQCRCAENEAEEKLAESDGTAGWLASPVFLSAEPLPGFRAVSQLSRQAPGAAPSEHEVAGPPAPPLSPPPRPA